MKIGLTGKKGSGKSTVFTALTGLEPDPHQREGARLAIVEVADKRVDELTTMYQPKKTIFAQFELADFGGLSGDFPPALAAQLRTMDALTIVLTNHDAMGDTPKPAQELQDFVQELVLNDQIAVENRLERIEAGYKKGQRTPAVQAEEKVLRTFLLALEKGQLLKELEISGEDERLIRGFQFFTLKPMLAVLNSSEEQYHKNTAVLEEISKFYPVVEFCGSFEMELINMPAEEAAAFMQDMGITESARQRLTTAAYELLGLISFFTVGKDEVRAWTIHRGDTALDAAGTIHSDLARGFIRAECFNYEELIALGSEKALREKGLFRLEGKTYPVKDGDILSIRFSV